MLPQQAQADVCKPLALRLLRLPRRLIRCFSPFGDALYRLGDWPCKCLGFQLVHLPVDQDLPLKLNLGLREPTTVFRRESARYDAKPPP